MIVVVVIDVVVVDVVVVDVVVVAVVFVGSGSIIYYNFKIIYYSID